MMQAYETAEDESIADEKHKFGSMRIIEAQKSEINFKLGKKRPRVKILSVNDKELFDLLESIFVKPANIKFERYKMLSRKQQKKQRVL